MQTAKDLILQFTLFSCRQYTSQPRLAGTLLDAELTKTIKEQWIANGLEEVHLATYDVLLSFPNKSSPNVVSMIVS